jgi:LPS-assembly protein
MQRRRGSCIEWSQRLAVSAIACLMLGAGPVAIAQDLIPADFFNAPITAGGAAAIEADTLSIDSQSGNIVASGDVVLRYQGYTAQGARLIYNRTTTEVRFDGPAVLIDPSGNRIDGTDLEVTGGVRQGFVEALTITAYDGSRITADSVEYDEALRTLLINASYAPCGDCIDAEGRAIGWGVRASRIVRNAEDGSIEIEAPTLDLLGVPVLWLPYLWLPDLSGTVLENFETPSIAYSNEIGVKVDVPVRVYSSRFTDIILTPTLVSRQGFLLGAEWRQRFDTGSFNIRASGLYQFNPEVFAGTVGDRDWRGAVESTGTFRPIDTWTAGWSYTAFTDAAYLPDYLFTGADFAVNEVYTTHLTAETYFDMRLQEFRRLGNFTEADQDRQAMAIPNTRFSHLLALADGMGQIELTGRLLGIRREADDVSISNGVTRVHGYEGNKAHAAVQAAWENQWIVPGGLVVSPYVGLRADAASYDGASALPGAPAEMTLLSATPIAAIDVRWPLIAVDGSTNTHIVEPIAQLAYRGDGSTPGITNDDAQSFTFDDTNLFSFNRFSGWDRQETGLRANVGARYMANFVDGSYLELIGGQSFHLAGPNAFAGTDPAQPGATRALANDASYVVLGAYAGFTPDVRAGAKLQVDPQTASVMRAGLGASGSYGEYTGGLDYLYVAANPEAGVTSDQHEIGARVGVPLVDYWRANAGAAWDIAGNSWLQASGGLQYDDGYLEFGANATATGPTHRTPNDLRFMATFKLKAPAGLNIGF